MLSQLRQLSAVRDEPVSALVRAAVREYLERAEQPRAAAPGCAMSANGSIVDELIVLMRLDSTPYEKQSKKIDGMIDSQAKKLERVDKKQKQRSREQDKQWKQSTTAAKDFGNAVGKLGLQLGAVLGVSGGAAGLIGAVGALVGVELGLRRSAVATGLTNRQMQALSGTARRLGADAEAGGQALAQLAREQKQFAINGQAPGLQALGAIGVNVGPDRSPAQMIGDAQQRYRRMTPAQQSQTEAGLSAAGLSNDLIVMIKAPRDAAEEYAKSLDEAATENRKALDAVSDAMESVKNNALNLANTLAGIAQPYIEKFADWVHTGSVKLSEFADKVAAAGGGAEGFQQALAKDYPVLSAALEGLLQTVDVLGVGFQQLERAADGIADAFKSMGRKLLDTIAPEGTELRKNLDALGKRLDDGSKTMPSNADIGNAIIDWAKGAWGGALGLARTEGPTHLSQAANPLRLSTGAAGATGMMPTAQEAMQLMVTKYGRTPAEAAAIWGNLMQESGSNPAAINPKSGAAGLAQWLSKDRVDAFSAFAGTTPDKASWQTQLAFMFSDSEKGRLLAGLSAGGGVAGMTAGVMTKYEAPGKLEANLPRRLKFAQDALSQYQASTAGAQGNGTTINMNGPVTVKADDPRQLANGLQRAGAVTPYQSGSR
ncbi:phage tail tip lysozyme [Caballeronia novacaledonica]|uniref:Phage tail lysozyme domain-containing protein n=1 Tax=Caballeronia novacaledonica TaxID=1544861 RepID=A0AA37IE52_9BURK|nr:phage tail tip lysozyme [Caballeronia novacaledonica]GJH28165.1 hypothetical protein CBA19CS42_26635 [Caballeronia novacaledonica]